MYSHRLNLCGNLPLFSGQTGHSFERSVGERCACRYLFGVPDHKDACGSGAYDPMGLYSVP